MSKNKSTKRRNNYSETRFELNIKQLSSAFVCLKFGALVSGVILLAEKIYKSIALNLPRTSVHTLYDGLKPILIF